MRSSAPVADTRMPVRIGRVSSRDRLDERRGRHVDDVLAAGLGQWREVLGAQRADVERRRAADDLDVLLGRAQLERRAVAGQRARDLEHQPGGEDDGPFAFDGGREGHAQADLHVGGAQLGAVGTGTELDAGQRLDGAAGRGDARDDAELRKEVRA